MFPCLRSGGLGETELLHCENHFFLGRTARFSVMSGRLGGLSSMCTVCFTDFGFEYSGILARF